MRGKLLVRGHVPFLNSPFGGYYHNAVPPEDVEITHVGPGTPAGEWFRKFWHPIFVADQLKGSPKAIRILGEDLVLFRDGSGQIGLLELHCSHRGASLEFGQVELRGIRCCYHGWHFDVDGKILEIPSEQDRVATREHFFHGAYPTLEHNGLIFAYMGDPANRPKFPLLDTDGIMPAYGDEWVLAQVQHIRHCNWLQVRENAMDPAHFYFLHSMTGNNWFSKDFSYHAEWDFLETPSGMVAIDTRRMGDHAWVLVTDYIPPNLQVSPALEGSAGARGPSSRIPWLTWWTVPLDDVNSMHIGYWWARADEILQPDGGITRTSLRPYAERQRLPGDDDAQVSQRPIAIHQLEHLGSSDRGVIMLRNIVRRGIRNSGGIASNYIANGTSITTFCEERYFLLPKAATLEEDSRLLLSAGRRVVEERMRELGIG